MLEEEALRLQPSTEAGERAVRADHAVTRQDDGKRVLPVCRAYRPRRVAAEPEPSGLLAVAHRLSVRNRREREPTPALEVGAVQLEWKVERHEGTVEVRLELCGGIGENPRPAFRANAVAVKEHRP